MIRRRYQGYQATFPDSYMDSYIPIEKGSVWLVTLGTGQRLRKSPHNAVCAALGHLVTVARSQFREFSPAEQADRVCGLASCGMGDHDIAALVGWSVCAVRQVIGEHSGPACTETARNSEESFSTPCIHTAFHHTATD
jgi:hypothetical protein